MPKIPFPFKRNTVLHQPLIFQSASQAFLFGLLSAADRVHLLFPHRPNLFQSVSYTHFASRGHPIGSDFLDLSVFIQCKGDFSLWTLRSAVG